MNKEIILHLHCRNGLTLKTCTNMKKFNYEIYTNNALTGESGWDIMFVSVFAEDKKVAREMLSYFPNFDCVILFNYGIDINDMDFEALNAGMRFELTDHNNQHIQYI